MTPDQVTELLKAVHQQNWVIVVAGLLWLCVAGIHLWIAKRIEAAIENKQHFSRIRYEREMKVYEDVWPRPHKLQTTVLSLRPPVEIGPSRDQKEKNEEMKARRGKFLEDFNSVVLAVNHSRPFYSSDVWVELDRLVKLAWSEAIDWGLFSSPAMMSVKQNRGDYLDKAEKNAESINKQINVICECIRTRLSKFDSI